MIKLRKILIICFIFFLGYFLFFNSDTSTNPKKVISKETTSEKRAIFISYIELSKYVKNSDIDASKKNIVQMIKNIDELGFNMIILQVRSFNDAIYESEIFPWSSTVSIAEGVSPGYDILEYFIKSSHEYNIELHAWINPYRVRTNSDVTTITEGNPAYKYIDTDYLYVNDGIYLNPAKDEVIDLIVSGIEEILKKYDVDGISFDDYFYPDDNISVNDYNSYIENNSYITFSEYKLMRVNEMVERVHKVCEENKRVFGISPSGNISNNYSDISADVKRWGSSNKYVDYLMPQIYYGFFNEAQAFHNVLQEWENIVVDDSVKLLPALAFYKVGTIDKYAKGGINEWVENNDIIMREILLSRNLNNYDGFALYRYDYLFNKELMTDTTMKEIENIKEIMN